MGDDADARSEADRELEREIRRGRQFSMAEAIGRLAGPGGMKGASPASRVQAARAEVERHIRQHLADPIGVLPGVLAREIGESRTLLDGVDHPLAAAAEHIRQILAAPALLEEFVRMTDMEWGRVQGERPFFQIDGAPAHPADPYTIASVRTALTRYLAVVAAA